jgi:hypothetical protein
MQMTDEQKQKAAAWIADGMKLSDIQNRIAEEFGVRLTYMDVRFLADDLKVMPKDPPEPVKPAPAETTTTPASGDSADSASPIASPDEAPLTGGKVALTVDTLARAGTIVSGKVTFSDGKSAAWYLDQMGRLGVSPEEQGYRPPAGDVEEFQMQLDRELQKLGY